MTAFCDGASECFQRKAGVASRNVARSFSPKSDHGSRRKQGARDCMHDRPFAYAESIRLTPTSGTLLGRQGAGSGRALGRRSACPSSADPKPEAIVSADDRCRIDAATGVADVALLLHAYSGHGSAVAAFTRMGYPFESG
jgi:hypothetical protein